MRTDLYVIGSSLEALTDRQDVITQNLAHLQTTGYRRQTSIVGAFETMLQGNAGDARATFASHATGIDFTPGQIRHTGQATDVALQTPEEFFVVEGSEGRGYTRAGRFGRDASGRLVDTVGRPVLGTGGGPIALPPGPVAIASSGAVSVGDSEVGRLQIVRFADTGVLRHGRRGLLVDPTGIGDAPVAEPELVTQSLEGSNVDPMMELTRLIEAQRSYDQKHRAVSTVNEMNQQLIRFASGG